MRRKLSRPTTRRVLPLAANPDWQKASYRAPATSTYPLGASVVSASAGVRDWCRDGETCLIVPCGDAAALHAAIRCLLDDPGLRDRLGRNARAFAEREGSTEAFAKRFAARLRYASAHP